MVYKRYQHIEKYGAVETEGLLHGEVHLSYKIDGSNGLVFLKDDGTIGFGSRNRELSLDEDNNGFVNYFIAHPEIENKFKNALSAHPSWIVYGEWLIPVNIKRYKQDAWKRFYVFDVFDAESGRYIRFDEYLPILKEQGIDYIEEIAVLQDPTIDDIKALLPQTGNFLIENGLGEGIVIKNYEYRNRYGRQTWAKILTEDFVAIRQKKKQSKTIARNDGCVLEREIIGKYLTVEHVLKEKNKIEERVQIFEPKNIYELLNRVFDEFIHDNIELIIKKHHLPAINFRQLKAYSDEFVKECVGKLEG